MSVESEEKSIKEKKKEKRRIRKKKTKENALEKAISLVVETGKVEIGFNSSMKSLKKGTPKAVIVSSNIQKSRKKTIEELAGKGAKIIHAGVSSKRLGAICGKPYLVSVISVIDEGNSGILEIEA